MNLDRKDTKELKGSPIKVYNFSKPVINRIGQKEKGKKFVISLEKTMLEYKKYLKGLEKFY